MTSVLSSKLDEYGGVLLQLQAASLGHYAAPTGVVNALKQQAKGVSGLDTDALRESTRAAVGTRTGRNKAGEILKDFIVQFVVGLASGKLVDTFWSLIDDGEEESRESQELCDSADQCCDTIDDIVHVSESAIFEVLSAAITLISIVVSIMKKAPGHVRLVGMLAGLVAPVVEDANNQIRHILDDRDDGLDACFTEFERRCEQVCERELPKPAPEVAECEKPAPPQPAPAPELPDKPAAPEPAPTKPTASPPSSAPVPPHQPPVAGDPQGPVKEPAAVPTQPAAAPEKDCPPVVTKPVAPTTETPGRVDSSEVGTTPASVGSSFGSSVIGGINFEAALKGHIESSVNQAVDQAVGAAVEEVEQAAKPIQEVAPEVPTEPVACDVNTSCVGNLGAVGAGMAILGVGLAIAAAAECLELACEVPEVDTEAPEPEAPPAAAPEPVEKPEPVKPEPAVKEDGVIPPPEELSEVEEPAPPPKKVAQPVPAAAPAPAPEAPAPEPTPHSSGGHSSGEAPQVANTDTSSIRARKAGQW